MIDIKLWDLLLGFSILVVPVLIFRYYKVRLNGDLIISVLRMIVQLFLVAVYLEWIFEKNNAWINTAWVLIMVMVGGGTGVAILHHVAKAFKEAGNNVISIIGAKDKEMLILEREMKAISDELVVTTDDGSYGQMGFVTDPLKKYLDERHDVKLVYAIGPIIMMKFVTQLTKKHKTPTMVSLNPIMIDGTGMCGGCRVKVSDKTKFCCVDGPDFDAFEVDFDELLNRNSLYIHDEKESLLASIR